MFNLNFNNQNRQTNNQIKFNAKSYNINSNQNKVNTFNNNQPMYKSVTGKSYENYENVRIENQRFLDELGNKKNVQ